MTKKELWENPEFCMARELYRRTIQGSSEVRGRLPDFGDPGEEWDVSEMLRL